MPESKLKVKNQGTKVHVKSQKVATIKTRAAKSETVTVRSVKKTKDGVRVDVYDVKGKVVESMELPKEIFGSAINASLMAQAVRVYLANQRHGTQSTKTRGEVRGSTRKIYRQKGTGRARHGGVRAPIFVGGGITFGPKPRDFSLAMPKKMKRKALFSALSSKVKEGEVKIISGLSKIQPKTKEMVKVIEKLELNKSKKKILLVLGSNRHDVSNVDRAARNIEGVRLLPAHDLNTYEVLNNKMLLVMKESIDVLSKTFLQK